MENIVIYVSISTFVQADIDILKADKYKYKNPFHQLWFFLTHYYERYFIWFCDYHALIPILIAKLTGKKSYIFVGGYDVYGIKEPYRYGVFTTWSRGFIAKICYRMCTKIFPVDWSLVSELKNHINYHSFRNKITVIPTGYDVDFWHNKDKKEIKYDYVTIGNIYNEVTYWRKGIDRFIDLAIKKPKKRFLIIGYSINKPLPKNIDFLCFIPTDDIRYILRKTKYYCQFSRIEGLPNALIEAMLCGCIPIITNIASLRDVVGTTGIWYENLLYNYATGDPRRQVLHYTLENRKHKILEEI